MVGQALRFCALIRSQEVAGLELLDSIADVATKGSDNGDACIGRPSQYGVVHVSAHRTEQHDRMIFLKEPAMQADRKFRTALVVQRHQSKTPARDPASFIDVV